MMLGFPATKKGILRVAAVFAVAMSASACSSMPSVPDVPDWVDPTTWFGDDSSSAANESGQTPDLANLPDKPAASSSADQQQVSESLAADRSNAKYSADALRGGTESAAAPPPDVAPVASSSELPLSSESKTARQDTSPPAPQPRAAQVDQSVAQVPTGPVMPGTLPSPGPATRVASIPVPVQTADMPPPGAQPAVPPTPAVPEQMASIAPSDAALGFKPSHAPPLDPSVSQFVAPPIIQHYQQTAAIAGLRPANPAVASTTRTRLRRPHAAEMGEGGPEAMSGAVVANLDAIQPNQSRPSVYASPQGMPATAVVFFPGDSVNLSPEARAQVRAAAEQYKAGGGQGFIRVVGHSSSRTANMPVERHLEVIFQKSQERASAVAQELIHDGVPASKVLVEAVGDSQPVYYESMPKGEDGNRRAEIFLLG
jgi:outer membrane protein OmpA-like peptidoglycan-associated protein